MTVTDLFGTGALAVLLAVAVVVTCTLLARERRASRALRAQQVPSVEPHDAPPRQRRAAIVVNPTKFSVLDQHALRRRQAYVAAVFRSHGWADPLWLPTTIDEPGGPQADRKSVV